MRKMFTFLFSVTINLCFGQWSSSPSVNTAVCTSATGQTATRIVTDGNGGAIITWWDYDASANDYDIYAQRINANGVIEWAPGGAVICGNALHQQNPEIASDGFGGAIIVWQDNRSGTCEIYGQKINASGQVQWTADGVSVGQATNCQTFPQVISDGTGGAFVTWKDLRNGSSYRIYAQRIDASGAGQWGIGGVSMSTGTNNQGEPQITSDGSGGIIVAYQEYIGTGPTAHYDVYAQRVDAGGVIQWGIDGAVISAAPNFQQRVQITTDGNNGAIIVWEDTRSGSGSNTYAQKVNGSGSPQWTLNGVALGPEGLSQSGRKIITDGSGGAFVAWRNGNNQIYGQHIDASGSLLWGATGLQIINANNAIDAQLINDGAAGTIITWCDYRAPNAPNIYAQRVSAAGSFLWAAAGVNISTALNGQVSPQIISSTGGTAIIDWMDYRTDAASDIYASRLNPDGTLGFVALPVSLIRLETNKTGQVIQLHWQTASEKNFSHFNIERSNDGRQFAQIGKLHTTGNSEEIRNYRFTDNTPLKGVNYYRLQLVDQDGKFSYSPVLHVRNDVNGILFAISPNPAKDFINISYAGKKEMVEISIYDIHGKLLRQQTRKNELPLKVEMHQIEPGLYFIQLFDGETRQEGKFIKQW